MALTLPFGVRIAAGLIGTAFDRLVTLPKELPSIGVTLAGQAVRSSLRFQQELAGLATRGDELLSGITGGPEEHPAWATFDDDDEDEARADQAEPATTPAPPKAPSGRSRAHAPSPMPIQGDHLLRLGELKERLQDMDIAAVRELLVLEQAGPGRAAYLTLLENRLTTLGHENEQSPSS